MQPAYMPIAQIFGAQTIHAVPLFQRPYVWSMEDQWEPLWEDVVGVLARLEERQGEAQVASHFLGTVVLEQTPNSTGSLPTRQVIDGQQRLTTLQILLKAALKDYLKLIVLDLDPSDEPQAIFETLNGTGFARSAHPSDGLRDRIPLCLRLMVDLSTGSV